ncbi:TPA: restriction endonuclease [Vibrio metoecus]
MKEYYEFEELVAKIFVHSGFKVEDVNKTFTTKDGKRLELDFSISKSNKKSAVEVKLYRSKVPNHYYKRAVLALRLRIFELGFDSGVLVTTSVMPESLKQEIEDSGIVVIDQFELIELAADSIELSEKLASLLSERPAKVVKTKKRHNKTQIIAKLQNAKQFSSAKPLSFLNQIPKPRDYCKELRAINPGRADFSKYEKKCVEILRYLFDAHLTGWKTQQSSNDNLNRFDLVTRVRSESDFWRFLSRELGSRYIIFEFKNYQDEIEQGEVLTTEKYLHKTALRTVAFMVSRKGASPNAIKFAEGAMREHGKLIIILEDNELCKMLSMKEQGDDPSEYLFEKVDDFLMSLPR